MQQETCCCVHWLPFECMTSQDEKHLGHPFFSSSTRRNSHGEGGAHPRSSPSIAGFLSAKGVGCEPGKGVYLKVAMGRAWRWDEVRAHHQKDDLWLVIDNGVYDCTEWISKHPGGDVLLHFGGRDATDAFAAFHEPNVRKRLQAFQVGVLDERDRDVPEDLRDFRKLRDQLWKEGWFEPRFEGVAVTLLTVACTAAACLWFTIQCSSRMAHLLGSCLLGIFWKQCLLFAHDACHRCATRIKRVDRTLGPLFGTLLGGVGAGWWNRDHNMHHAVTQVANADPSAGCPPILCTDSLQVKSVHWITKTMLKLQALYYIPLCVFVGRYNLHLVSLVLCPPRQRVRDMVLMAGYALYVSKLLSYLPPRERWLYFFAANSVTGILHLILNMNHYCMPMQASMKSADEMGFFRFQLTGTSNIKSNLVQRWYYGGLEHQIEHHLFPLMPRYNLARVEQYVLELAKKHKVPYQTYGFFSANWAVLKTLGVVCIK